jgi:hypothetical protein
MGKLYNGQQTYNFFSSCEVLQVEDPPHLGKPIAGAETPCLQTVYTLVVHSSYLQPLAKLQPTVIGYVSWVDGMASLALLSQQQLRFS